jgi:hypothetical protein
MEGVDELVKKIMDKRDDKTTPLPPQAGEMVKALVTGTVMKPTERVFGFKLPDKPVSKGDKWTHKLSSTFGPLKLTVVNNYTYDGTADGREKVTAAPEITFSPGDSKGGGPLGQSIKKADLKAEKAKGVIWFDNAAGRLAQNDQEVVLKGSVTISFMNQDFPADIEIHSNTKTKVLDKAP